MAVFAAPTFYMPWQARVNPALEQARAHTKHWAQAVGIIGSPDAVWSEAYFDAADFAFFTASVHPDACAPVLDLLTDWYVWLFYFDDHFLERYKRGRDDAGARQHLRRMPGFMPIGDGDDDAPPPAPVDAAEHGLHDLWGRTTPAMPAAWQRRFAANYANLVEEFLWELRNLSDARVPNPIEYIEMRRRTGGMLWAADLVELAAQTAVPERLVATRPLRVARDTFADAVGLHNDIVSYDKEINDEGEVANGVLVVERFLGCDTQRAADLVNDLVTARVQAFEHAVAVRLGPVLDEHGADPAERAAVLRFVDGLRMWMAGDREWHQRSGRYRASDGAGGGAAADASTRPPIRGAAGLGTAAALPPRPRPATAPSGRAPRPEMPDTTAVNPALAAARRDIVAWCRALGMLDVVWDEARLRAIDTGLLAALTHPTAPEPELVLINRWNTWAFFVDDLLVEVFKRGRTIGAADVLAARLFCERLRAIMGGRLAGDVLLGPAERGLHELWSSMPPLAPDSRAAFAETVMSMIDPHVWELENLAAHRRPDAIEYVEMRRVAVAAWFSMNLARFVRPGGALLPERLLRTRPMRELLCAHADWQGLHNDLGSYAREHVYEGDTTHSGVDVLERLLGCTTAHACGVLRDLVSAREEQFERIAAHELEPLYDELDLDAAERSDAAGYVADLQLWMAGARRWSGETGRYSVPLGSGAQGLGTAAALVAQARRAVRAREQIALTR